MLLSKVKYCLIIVFLTCGISAFARKDSMEVVFFFKERFSKVENVEVTIYKDKQPLVTQQANGNSFLFKLSYHSFYHFVFKKKGFVTQSISFDTSGPEYETSRENSLTIHLRMIEQPKDGTSVVLNEPTDIYSFQDDLLMFDYDPIHRKVMKIKIKYLKKEIKSINEMQEQQKEIEEEKGVNKVLEQSVKIMGEVNDGKELENSIEEVKETEVDEIDD